MSSKPCPVNGKLLASGEKGGGGKSVVGLQQNSSSAKLTESHRLSYSSKSGKPFITPAGHQPAWSASKQVTWKSADALRPETYKEAAQSCDAVVHTVGIVLEAQYKGPKGPNTAEIWRALKNGWGIGNGQTNPLRRKDTLSSSSFTSPTYELMNRDTALTVARTFSSTRTLGDLSPFVYISAEDIFRPIISSRYIETKRQAEDGISEIASESDNIRPIFLRPGEALFKEYIVKIHSYLAFSLPSSRSHVSSTD